MKLLKVLNTKILNEVSEKLKNQLYTKFKDETSDSREEIISYIDLFDRYKDGLPADKRDITKYSYKDLKSFVDSKKSLKSISDIFKEFKKKEKGIENVQLKKYIKKFLEIQSELPKEYQDITKFNFLQLVELINKVYGKLINDKLIKKFSKENPNLTKDQIMFYISDYIENFDLIPFETKGIDKMSFSELEHLLDGLQGKKEGKQGPKEEISDIDLKYNQNNLKIFAPKTKDQCIRLKNGRSWCTSREGSGNMYYNYRLGNERTLYYVIDEDKDFSDLNFSVVILVDPDGRMALADKSNSGRYAGSTNLPWSEIVSKVPKLDGLKSIFKPEPLTKEEKILINKVKNARVGDNPMKSFDSPDEVEMWLEYNSPKLSNVQYSNLTPKLKKKYIALGMELSSEMIRDSEPEVIKYYLSKRIDTIKNSDINSLSSADIELLNSPQLKKLKEELKPKFASSLVLGGDILKIEDLGGGITGKFITLYGLEDLIPSLPSNLREIQITNKSKNDLVITIPQNISRFKQLELVLFDNCVDSVPENICSLNNLRFLSLLNNPNLTQIPECIMDIDSLSLVNLQGSKNIEIFEKLKSFNVGEGIYIIN